MFGTTINPWFDQTVLLVGATDGLGPDLARALLARGARPVAIDRDPGALARLAAELGGLVTLAADPAEPARAVAIARWLADEHPALAGAIWVLPRNAGPGALATALALAGLTGGHRGGPAPFVGLVLPEAAPARGLAGLAARLRDLRWAGRGGGGVAVSAILAADGLTLAGPDARRRAAQRILGAVATGQATLRIAAGRRPAWARESAAPPCLQEG